MSAQLLANRIQPGDRSVIYLPPLPCVLRESANQPVAWGSISPPCPAEQADPQPCCCHLPPLYISSQGLRPFHVSILLLSPWVTITSTTISLLSVFIFPILSGFSLYTFFTVQQQFFLRKAEPRSHSCASQTRALEHKQLNLWAVGYTTGLQAYTFAWCLLNQMHS